MRRLFPLALALVLIALSALTAASPAFAAKKKAATAPAAAPAVEPRTVLSSVPRMISYDPHPTTFRLAQPVTVDGRPFAAEIEILEKWESKKSNAYLRELGARLRLSENGAVVQTVEIAPVKLSSGKGKKGFVLGEAKGNGVGLAIVLDKAQGGLAAATELTVEFQVFALAAGATPAPAAAAAAAAPTAPVPTTATGPEPVPATAPAAAAGTAGEPTPALVRPGEPTHQGAAATPGQPTAGSTAAQTAPALPAGSLGIAMKLAEKAAALSDTAAAAKIKLLEQALRAAPAADLSAEAAAFRQDLEARLTTLRTAAPAPAPAAGAGTVPGTVAAAAPAAQADPQAVAWYQEAKTLFDQQKEPEARELLRKAVEKDPSFRDGWFLLGKNAAANGKHARAMEALDKALSLKDDDVEAARLYFKSAYYTGDAEAGLDKLRGLSNRYPDNLEARRALADALFQANDLPGCEEECLKVLQARPNDRAATELLERARQRMK
ncbi:MAG: tetratricopeptide repeat protein [Candidatus Riflebacteria bacterium]|nr:tetratricopeptide repeat protein [Candidatus Riflebacteria bacterium]